jgi:hypothetical protein
LCNLDGIVDCERFWVNLHSLVFAWLDSDRLCDLDGIPDGGDSV